MIRKWAIFSIFLTGLLACSLAETGEVFTLAPKDSQIIMELHAGDFLHKLVRESGKEEELLRLMEPVFNRLENTITAPEKAEFLRKLMDSSVLVAADLEDWRTQPPRFRLLAAIEFADSETFRALSSLMTPPAEQSESPQTVGSFQVYRQKISPGGDKSEAESSPAPPGFSLAVGRQMVILGFGHELNQLLGDWPTGKEAAGWTEILDAADPAFAGRNIMRMKITPGELYHKMLVEVRAQLEAQQKALQEAAQKQAGDQSGEEQPASQVPPFLTDPGKVMAFIEGLGLEQFRQAVMVVREDGDLMRMTTSAWVDPGESLVGNYLASLRGGSVSVFSRLPENTVVFNDLRCIDLSLLFGELMNLSQNSFGPQAASLFGMGEAMVTMQTGLGLQNDILPFFGGEQGLVILGGPAAAEKEYGALPPLAFFVVPRQEVLFSKLLDTLGKRLKLEISSAEYKGTQIHSFSPPSAEPASLRIFLAQIGEAVFFGVSPDVLRQIIDGRESGRTLARNPLFQPYLGLASDGCIQFALVDMKAVSGMYEKLPEDFPFASILSVFKNDRMDGVSVQRAYVRDEGVVAVTETSRGTFQTYLEMLMKLAGEAVKSTGGKPETEEEK